MKGIKIALASISVIALSGCATGQYNPNVYQGSQANIIGGYQSGVVTAVRDVAIQDDPTGFGAVSGALIGGLIGSQVGGGSGQYIGAAIGTTAGGVFGNSVENNTARTNAQEITVQLNNGSNLVIVQGNTQNISKGQRVKLMSNNGNYRIVK